VNTYSRVLRCTIGVHFCSLATWPWDFIACVFFTAAVTPAEPYTLVWSLPVFAGWMSLRWVIARRLRGTAISRLAAMRFH
jgi:hypothetical protein